MKVAFCEKCHKLVTIPSNISIGGSITLTCPDGHYAKTNRRRGKRTKLASLVSNTEV